MLGTHHLLDGYYADRAGFVFNYKTLPERLPHVLRHDARHYVDRTAWSKRHQDFDRPIGIWSWAEAAMGARTIRSAIARDASSFLTVAIGSTFAKRDDFCCHSKHILLLNVEKEAREAAVPSR